MKEINSENRGAVHVSLPASVASDIAVLKKAVGGVLGQLGCPACCSGHDIFFELQRDVMFEKLNAQPQPALSVRSKFNNKATVKASINPKLVNKIDNVYEVIDQMAKISGHPACATGCDMFLQMERTLVMDETLNIRELDMRFA